MKRMAALFAVTAAVSGIVPATAPAAASGETCQTLLLALRFC